MKAIDVAGFEGKFRENIDPWDYTNSRFEHFKRTVLLRACGHGKHGRALELGCAIGETTRHLAPLCLRLVALDGSPTAIAEAKRRVQSAHVRFMLAKLPGQMPHGPFDLIVVSEIAYYLSVHELALLWQIFSGTGFPNQFFNDSWVVGFWRADHGRHDVELGRRASRMAQAVLGSPGP